RSCRRASAVPGLERAHAPLERRDALGEVGSHLTDERVLAGELGPAGRVGGVEPCRQPLDGCRIVAAQPEPPGESPAEPAHLTAPRCHTMLRSYARSPRTTAVARC